MNTQKKLWIVHILFAFFIYAFFLDIHTLFPWNVDWLMNTHTDTWINYTYYLHFKSTRWIFPLGFTEALTTFQDRSYLAFADGKTWMSFLGKVVSHFFSNNWQYFGLAWFFALVLQSKISYTVFSKICPENTFLNRFLASSMMVLAPWFIYRYQHHALFHHWIVLWGMYLSFQKTFSYSSFLKHSIFLMGFAAGLHAYYLPILGILFFSKFVVYTQTHDVSWMKSMSGFMVSLFSAVCVLYVYGYFSISTKDMSAGGLGYYSANFLTWFDPTSMLGTISSLMPQIGKGPGQYEGLAYFGLGGFCLTAMAFYIHLQHPLVFQKHWFLPLCACAFLAFWAIGPDVMFANTHILDLSILYTPFIKFFSIFRSHGRFIWPLSYAVWIAALIVVLKHPNAVFQTRLLAVCLGLQCADLLALSHEIKKSHTTYTPKLLREKEWNSLLSNASGVYFYPPYHLNTRFLQYTPQNPFLAPLIARCAEKALPLNSSLLPRVDREDLEKQSLQFMKNFEEGKTDSKGVYIIHPIAQKSLGNVLNRMDCKTLDGFYTCIKKP
jgi:hypothetical protein